MQAEDRSVLCERAAALFTGLRVSRGTYVYNDQKNQDRNKHERGQGIDFGLDAPFCHRVDAQRERGNARTRREKRNDKIIDRHCESQDKARHDTGADLRQDDLEKGLYRRRAQILRRLEHKAVELYELRCDGKDDVGDIECDMRQEKGNAAQWNAQEHVEDEQGNTCYNLRVQHGQIRHVHQQRFEPAVQIKDADSGACADQNSNDRGNDRDQQRSVKRLHDVAVLKERPVPFERKACPLAARLRLIEREHDQYDDRRIEEQKN